MPVDTNALIQASRCIDSCVPDGAKLAVIISLLSQSSQALGGPYTWIWGTDGNRWPVRVEVVDGVPTGKLIWYDPTTI